MAMAKTPADEGSQGGLFVSKMDTEDAESSRIHDHMTDTTTTRTDTCTTNTCTTTPSSCHAHQPTSPTPSSSLIGPLKDHHVCDDFTLPPNLYVKANKRAPLRLYSIEDVRKHNTKEDCWVIVDGKVYDVTSWIERHPGGELLILDVAGMDITDAFLVNHLSWVREKLLPHYQVGYVRDYAPSAMSKDFCDMALMLEKNGWYTTSYWYYAGMVTWYIGLFASSLFCIFKGQTFFPRCILSALLMAIFWQQIAFLGHDLGHMAVTHDRVVDNLMGVCGGNLFMGIAIGWWKATHNVHHLVTNYLEYDPDIQHLPVLAVTDKFFSGVYSFYHERRMEFDKVAQFFVRRQHWLFYPVMFVARFNLYLQSILLLIRPAEARRRGVSYPRLELLMLAGFYTWFTLLLRYFPSWTERTIFVILSHGAAGILHLQICLSHFSMDIMDQKKDGKPLEKTEFLRQQVETCLDVDCAKTNDWFHGGLQFQTAHHLFPLMPRHRLRELVPLTEDLCAKHHMEYHKVPFWDANRMILGTLRTTADRLHPWLYSLLMCEG